VKSVHCGTNGKNTLLLLSTLPMSTFVNAAKEWCLKDVVCAGPLLWHCPDAAQQLLPCVGRLLRSQCSFLFQTLQRPLLSRESSYPVPSPPRLKPRSKALCIPLFPASSAYLCGHGTPHSCRGLGVLIDQFCSLCVCPWPAAWEGSTRYFNVSFVLRWTVVLKSQRGNSEPFLLVFGPVP